MQEAELMARTVVDCTVRDPRSMEFNAETGELVIRDATAVPVEEIAGTDLGFYIQPETAYLLGMKMLAYFKMRTEARQEELVRERCALADEIADLRDHIQRLECPYETKQEQYEEEGDE